MEEAGKNAPSAAVKDAKGAVNVLPKVKSATNAQALPTSQQASYVPKIRKTSWG